jgi:hypothetical protein
MCYQGFLSAAAVGTSNQGPPSRMWLRPQFLRTYTLCVAGAARRIQTEVSIIFGLNEFHRLNHLVLTVYWGSDCSGHSEGSDCLGRSEGLDCSDHSEGLDCLGRSEGSDCLGRSEGLDCLGRSEGLDCSGRSEGSDCSDHSEGLDCLGRSEGLDCLGLDS